MSVLIQYSLEDGTWSDWTLCVVQDEQLLLDGQSFEDGVFRVLKDNNFDNPNVAWWILHEGHLYEAIKSKNFINNAIPIFDKTLKPIAIDKLEGDFSLSAFDEMFHSAQDYLAPCLFDSTIIDELLVRPADASQNINLMAAETTAEQAQNWWKDLYDKYFNDVKKKLMAIIQQPLTRLQQINAIKTFLAEHHQWIAGSCLDYVALPNHSVTRGLINIAERIAIEMKVPAIKILMPGIAMESVKDGFANLTDLSLQNIVENHIVLNPKYLLPVSSLNEYIQHPDATLYSPYCFDDYRPRAARSEDINALFEHSEATQDIKNAFQAYQSLLNQEDNLLGQLNVLGKKLKSYDAHGGLGQQESAGSGAYPAIMNFMQYYLSLEPCYLSLTDKAPSLEDLPEEYRIGYAFYENQLYFINRYEQTIISVTQPNHPAKFSVYLARFHELADVPQNIQTPIIVKTDDGGYTFFPGQHPIDARAIDVNFPKEQQRIISCSESNIPQEIFTEIATTGFNAPLFSELFKEKLTESQVLSADDLAFIDIHTEHSFMSGYTPVPQDLRNEIELLWQLFHNPAKNIEATRNIATCIGTRGEQIRSMTKRYEHELIQIGIHPEEKFRLLEDAKANLASQLQIFNMNPHPGSDKYLGLTFALIARYQKTITIRTLQDCYFLNSFHPRELSSILQNDPNLIEDFKYQLWNDQKFVMYLSETSLPILEVVLPHMLELVISHLPRFQQIFEIIGIEKTELLMKQLLISLMKMGRDFTYITNSLSSIKRAQFFEILQPLWPDLINNVETLFAVIKCMSPEERSLVLGPLKDCWTRIIKNIEDFYFVVEHLSENQRTQIFEAFEGRWLALINTSDDFCKVTEYLSENQRTQIFEAFEGRWLVLINSGEDFCKVTEYLSENQRTQIFEAFEGRWPEIIKSIHHFRLTIKNVSPDQCTQLIEILKENWSDYIKNTYDLFYVIKKTLTDEQAMQILSALNGYWLNIITNGDCFKELTENLKCEQLTQVFDALNGHWFELIKSSEDFCKVTENLSDEQRIDVFENLRHYLPSMILTSMDFKWVTQNLSEAQRVELFESLRHHLPNMILTSMDFKWVTQNLSEAQRMEVFDACSGQWMHLIKNVNDFNHIIKSIPDVLRIKLIRALKMQFSNIIKNSMDFYSIIQHLSEIQRHEVFEALSGQWLNIIKTGVDFESVTQNLSELQRSQIMTCLAGHWSSIFKDEWDFESAIENLTSEQKRQILMEMNHGWIEIIQNAKGDKSIRQTIQDLYEEPSLDIWGDIPQLHATIKNLFFGIKKLHNFCDNADIECFLAAMLTEDASLINAELERLMASNFEERNHRFFFPKCEPRVEILKIVCETFPDFCTRHLQVLERSNDTPENNSNSLNRYK